MGSSVVRFLNRTAGISLSESDCNVSTSVSPDTWRNRQYVPGAYNLQACRQVEALQTEQPCLSLLLDPVALSSKLHGAQSEWHGALAKNVVKIVRLSD
jgi:hypothetical protein